MRLTWGGIEEAAAIMGWQVHRKPGSQVCTLDCNVDDYTKFDYNKEQALLHVLTALLFNFKPEEIRDKMKWRPATLRGKDGAVFEYMAENYPASLCAVMSRIWPNSLLDS